ncbi:MAG: hypothetical protein DMD69_02760 [Gemmatimonadetes bacterium]|nr:MAG: hypothetical protein DMD69_02760 [Gemmatimonadota bacterium]
MKSALKLALLAVLALALPFTGCNDPLNVQDPDIVAPGNLNDKSVLPTIRAGAIGDFALAYTGSGADGSGGTVEGVTMYGGLLADEWINSETFPTRIEVDSRGPIQKTNADVGLWFRNMHRARRAAEFAAERYRTLAPDTTAETGLSEVLSLAGYTYVFFAETWCSGVPVSTVAADGTITYGAPLSTLQLLNTAIGRFDEATAAATALDTTRVSATTRRTLIRLAAVGKARALLDQGQFATAAALVSSTAVPTSFSYTVQHSENTTRENNGVFNATQIFKRYAVGDREGGYTAAFAPSGTGPGLPYRSSGDPRIQWRLVITPPTAPATKPDTNKGFDGSTLQYDQTRYTSRSAAITLATGAEARLIEAEAALQAGDTATGGSFYTTLNGLRSAPPSYFALATPLVALTTDSATAAGGAVSLLFRERAYWLWITAHRLGDLRRLIRQYGRAADAVFPSGAYFKSQVPTYGSDVNFPVPVDEGNNPNFTQCIDRNP